MLRDKTETEKKILVTETEKKILTPKQKPQATELLSSFLNFQCAFCPNFPTEEYNILL